MPGNFKKGQKGFSKKPDSHKKTHRKREPPNKDCGMFSKLTILCALCAAAATPEADFSQRGDVYAIADTH